MRANVRATGPLAHAWRDRDGDAQSTVRSVNVGSYPGSARLVATQRIGEECQLPTHALQQAAPVFMALTCRWRSRPVAEHGLDNLISECKDRTSMSS